MIETIRWLEDLFSESLLKKDTLVVDSDHLEEDTLIILDDKGHQQYQILIGMLNWIARIGRMGVTFAIASQSRFAACPRKEHRDRALRILDI